MLPNGQPDPREAADAAGLWLFGSGTAEPPRRDRQADQAARAGLFEALRARGIEPIPGAGLSHSGGFAAYGENRPGSRTGVDLEWIRERNVLSLAEFAYSPEEFGWLKTLTDTERQTAFVELWVLKEAAGKALGLDLFDALRSCRFTLSENTAAADIPSEKIWTALLFAPRPLLRMAVLLECHGNQDTVTPVVQEIKKTQNNPQHYKGVLHGPTKSGTSTGDRAIIDSCFLPTSSRN